MRPVALLTRQWPQAAHKALATLCETRYLMPDTDVSADFFRAFNKDVNILCLSFLDDINPKLIKALPGLQLITHVGPWHRFEVGSDPCATVSLENAIPQNIQVCDSGDAAIGEMADYGLALLLSVTRRMNQPLHSAPTERTLDQELGRSLHGRTAGFLGIDHIALELAERLAVVGIESIYAAPRPDAQADGANLKYFDNPATVLDLADAVSLHDIEYRLDESMLAHCRHDCVIINLIDASLIDEAALVDALKNHRIAGAGLDVSRNIQLLHNCPNLVLTPRLSTNTLQARLEMTYRVVENIKMFLATGEVIDPIS